MKARWWLLPPILTVLLSGCEGNSQLHVVNGTNEAVKSLTIAVPGSRLEIRDLGVGHTRSWRYRPERDSCFEVRARFVSGAAMEVSCRTRPPMRGYPTALPWAATVLLGMKCSTN